MLFIKPYPERLGFQEMLFQKTLTQKVWVLRNASSEKRSFNTSTPYVPCFGSKLFPPKTRPPSAVASFPGRHLPAASLPWYKIHGNMAASGGVCAGGHLGAQMQQSLLEQICDHLFICHKVHFRCQSHKLPHTHCCVITECSIMHHNNSCRFCYTVHFSNMTNSKLSF
jgi:hypothetical protein